MPKHDAMDRLQALTREARALADGQLPSSPLLSVDEAEVSRQMQICNACRYCEGFCAVFPAMTRRLEFGKADIHFLANLCHNCGACLYACQYAPPHEFAVNVPQAMAKVRRQTYTEYAWPRALGPLVRSNGLTLGAGLAVALSLFLWVLGRNGTLVNPTNTSDFYGVFSHNRMVSLFAPVFVYAVLALTLGLRRFWRDISPATSGRAPDMSGPARTNAPLTPAAALEAVGNAATLKYLDGGHGEGCNNEDDEASHARRWAHHLTFYGFLLCLAATTAATLLHYLLKVPAPYALISLPKLLGVSGGLMLAAGTPGLFWLNLQRNPLQGDTAQKSMDLGFIALLFLTSTSGLALWWARGSAALPAFLALHLGVVLALFVTLPYSKFAHGLFRTAALLRHNVEKRLPSALALKDD